MFRTFAKSFVLTAGLFAAAQANFPTTTAWAADDPWAPSVSGFEIRDRNGVSHGLRFYATFSAAMKARDSLMERMPDQRLSYPKKYNIAELREYYRKRANYLRQRKTGLNSQWANLNRRVDTVNAGIRRADAERAAINRELDRIRYLESRIVVPPRVLGERANLSPDIAIRNYSLRSEINDASSRLESRIADLRAEDARLARQSAEYKRWLSEYQRDVRTVQTQTAESNQSESSLTNALRAQQNSVRPKPSPAGSSGGQSRGTGVRLVDPFRQEPPAPSFGTSSGGDKAGPSPSWSSDKPAFTPH
jgi:hypothetical protein